MTSARDADRAASGTARPIWLCADDYGISESVDKAIRDLLMRGHINATSVMVVAPSFQRAEAASLKMLNAGTRRFGIGLASDADRAVQAAEPRLSPAARRRVPAAA